MKKWMNVVGNFDELSWTAPVFKIAAINGDGTRELMFAIMDFLEEQRRKDSEQE